MLCKRVANLFGPDREFRHLSLLQLIQIHKV